MPVLLLLGEIVSVRQTEDLAYYCSEGLNGVLHSYDYVQGMVFSVAAAPEIPMPETWLPWAFCKHGQLNGIEQADKLTDLLMKELQSQLQIMRDDKVALPQRLTFSTAPDSPVSQWLNGLLAGHSQLETVWQQAWQRVAQQSPNKLPKMQKDLRYCLSMFTTFANPSLAIEQSGSESLESNLPKIFLSLSDALNTYTGLSGLLVDFMPNQFETFTQTKET